MNRKLILEGILFFLICLMAIDKAIANYAKMTIPSIDNYLAKGDPVINKGQIQQIQQGKKDICSSNVLYAKFDRSIGVFKYQTFSDAEIDILIELAKKMGSEKFETFMSFCIVIERSKFMLLAENELKETEFTTVAKNVKINKE